MQLEIRIGQLLFRDGKVLRHIELLVAPARPLEAGERIAVMPARKLEESDRLFDDRFEHRQAMRGRAHGGPRVDARGFVEVAQCRERTGQADVGHHRVLAIADAREQDCGLAVVARGLLEIVAAHMEAAQVQAHLPGRTDVT